MKGTTVLVFFVGLCIPRYAPGEEAAAAGAVQDPVLKEIEKLKKENEDLRNRVGALEAGSLETSVPKKAEAEAAGKDKVQPEAIPAAVPGKFQVPGVPGLTLDFGGDIRLRNEDIQNGFDLNNDVNDHWNSTRLRTRFNLDVDYKNIAGMFVQLTNEYRWGSDTKYNPDFQAEDIRVDNAYVRINHFMDTPFIFTGGRQDLLAAPEKGWGGWYGEAWLLFDGTPNDGSATIAFDSLKLRFDGIPDTTIDLIYAEMSERNRSADASLRNLYADSDWDEDLFALYGISRFSGVQLDLYAMGRNKNVSVNYLGAAGNFWDPELITGVFGGRVATAEPLLDKHLSLACEGGYQTGYLIPGGTGFIGSTPYPAGERVDRSAFGVYAWANLSLAQEAPSLNPFGIVRFDYLSGDDPDTKGTFEGWDSMYAEWPKYSELLIYQYYDPFAPAHGSADPNLGAFTNMYFPTVELGIWPFEKKLQVKGGYRYMQADQKNGPGEGSHLGDLLQFYTEYRPYPYLRAHFYFDYFFPGTYYDRGADESWFSRVEVMFLF
jgi:hypothetical protein